MPIWLPPLRERREDIPLLTDHFMQRFFRERGDAGARALATVRDGVHALPVARQRARAGERVRARRADVHVQHGPRRLHAGERPVPYADAVGAAAGRAPRPIRAAVSLDDRLQEVESHLITWALKVSHGNKSKAAELLQIKRSTLGDRIRKLGLDHLDQED